MSEYFESGQRWANYVVKAGPTPEQIQDRTAYWEEQLEIANKFKEVAEKELARLAILQEGLW